MEKPIIIVNFKTYEKGTGKKALELAKICEKVSKEEDADIRVAVQPSDIKNIASQVSIPVYSQHIDPVNFGSNTGWILPEAVKEAGAVGTLLNHSEHRREIEVIEETVKRAKEVGLAVVICAENDDEGVEMNKFNPDFIAVEPPELIGGDISISTAQPELIKNSVAKICDREKSHLIVGAGVKTGEDVKIGLELGACGVLPASGIVKVDDPEAALRGLLDY